MAHMRSAIAALGVAMVLSGCYTDPATGGIRFGSRPQGPTADQIRDQRIATLEQTIRSLRAELDTIGGSVSSAATRSEETSRALDARGADAVALRRDMSALSARVSDLEGRMDKVPSAIATAVGSERKTIVAEVNKAIADSDARTNKAISDAIAQSSRASSSSSKGSAKTASTGPKIAADCYEHVVQSGETLSAIASAYGSNVNAIMKATGLSDPSKLRVGQKVYIPVK